MKRHHWWFIGGIALGIVLAGARCSIKYDDSNPECKVYNATWGEKNGH